MSDHRYHEEWAADEELPEEDEQPEAPSIPRRQTGRTPPPVVETSFEIKLDGVIIGRVYPNRLTGAAQLDLEDAQSTRQVIDWLVKYADGDARQVEAMLRSLPLQEVVTFIRQVAQALTKSLKMGKPRGQGY